LEHNPDQVTDLIERTIQRQRSIGTLDLTLRELRMDSERRALGERLERAIGGPAFLRLIAANGSVFELFSILKQTSAALAEAMLTALEHNPDQVTDLIERTIQSQRSIGTLSLALRELRMDPERRALGERLERIIGVQGFWSLIIGVGGAGPMLSLLGHMSPAFRKDFLSESSHLRSADWARVLERGDFFALVRLLNQGGALLTVPTTASELQTAVADTAAAITASSSWYARNGGRIRLEALPQTPHVAQLLEVLNRTLDAVTVDGLACASVQEGANALELLCRRRADARPLLAARLWRLVPPPPAWQLEPGKDSGVLRVLLRAMAYPEFDDGDARRVFDGCAAWLTPTRIAKLDAREVAGTLWALVALAAQRGWATHLCAAPAELPTTLRTALVADLSRRAGSASRDLNEVRGRFALAGLLSLAHAPLPQLAPPAGVAFVNAATTAWWLCANQSFVFAALVLRAVAQQWPLSPADQHLFRHHLEGAARQLLELDPAATWLLQDAQGTRSAPGMPQLPQSRPQR
ncbi:MAG: hypothetical protein NW204_14235, partial [Xanthomonadaceae bacterium]|nr:hypothetical protein [Xanthomonadaceae bacterium]